MFLPTLGNISDTTVTRPTLVTVSLTLFHWKYSHGTVSRVLCPKSIFSEAVDWLCHTLIGALMLSSKYSVPQFKLVNGICGYSLHTSTEICMEYRMSSLSELREGSSNSFFLCAQTAWHSFSPMSLLVFCCSQPMWKSLVQKSWPLPWSTYYLKVLFCHLLASSSGK